MIPDRLPRASRRPDESNVLVNDSLSATTDTATTKNKNWRMMEFKITIYGFSTGDNGYKFEVHNNETNELVHSGVEHSAEASEIEAVRFVDAYVAQPIKVLYRTVAID